MKLSVKNASLPEIPEDLMEGPVGAAFGYEDVVVPVKVLNNFSKEFDALNILGGLVEGKYITKEEAIELAKLPSRDELLAKLVGVLKAPISGFHGVLSGVLRNFVGVVSAYQEKKGKDAPTKETPKEEAKADTPTEDAQADETKADAPEEDATEDEAKADAPEEEAKVDAPEEEAKVDAPKEEAKVDAPKGEAKVDAPKDEAKADAPEEEAKPEPSDETK